MKKLFFLFAFMGLLAFTADAQKKACCAGKAKCDKTSMTSTSDATDVDKAAAADASIVKQVSDKGDVSYARKEVCPTTGKVSFTSVEYCSKDGKFVNVSPSEKGACCAKGASATKVSSKEKKACCAGGEKAGCCAKKGEKTTSTTSTANDGQVKLVSDPANN